MSRFASAYSNKVTLPTEYLPTIEDYANPEGVPVEKTTEGIPRMSPRETKPNEPMAGLTGVPLTTVLKGEVPQVGYQQVPTGETDVTGQSIYDVLPTEPSTSFTESENKRFDVPSQPVDLSSEEAAFNTLQGIVKEDIPSEVAKENFSLAGEKQTKTSFGDNYIPIRQKAPTELQAQAAFLAEQSQKLLGSILADETSAMNQQSNAIFKYLGLDNVYMTPEESNKMMDRLPGVLLLSAHDIAKQGYIQNKNQIEENVFDKEKDNEFKTAQELEAITNKDDKAIQAAIREIGSNPRKHASAHNQISQLAPLVKEKLYGTKSETAAGAGRVAMESSIPTSYALALDLINQGYMSLGRDKYGALHLMTGPMLSFDLQENIGEVSNAYNIATRGNSMVAQAIPTKGGIPANAAAQFILDEEARGVSVVDLTMSLIDSIPLTVSPTALKAELLMTEDIVKNGVYFYIDPSDPKGYNFIRGDMYDPQNSNVAIEDLIFAYSDSEFNHSLLNLTQARFMELLETHSMFEVDFQGKVKTNQQGKPVLNRIVASVGKNKLEQIHKHTQEYLGGLGNGLWYGMMKKSDTTHRMFQRATNINWINHSGTIRGAISFGRKPAIYVKDNKSLVANAKDMSAKLRNVKALSRQARGEKQLEILASASPEVQHQTGAIYILASIANELGILKPPKKQYSFTDLIDAFTPEHMQQLADIGQQASEWVNGNIPTLPASFPKDKKEWSPVLSATMMAYNMTQAEKLGGKHVTLDAIIEKDSSQSNAIIQALTIGDKQTAKLLGYDTYEMDIESEFKNLREKAASSVADDVIETFTNQEEAESREALVNFFNKAKEVTKDKFSKLYARGIVVAGLYGKHPSFMYEEAEDMLANISLAGLGEDVARLREQFKTADELHKAIAAVYTTSFYTHMSSLSMYQSVMKGFAAINAAAYGPTIWQTYGDQMVNMASAHGILTKVDKERLEKQRQDFIRTGSYEPGSVGQPYQITSDFEVQPMGSQRDVRATGELKASHAKKKRIAENLAKSEEGMEDSGWYEGKSFRDAFAVVTTQSGDSLMWGLASLAMHKRMKAKNAMNALPIHDAVLADASAILPFVISYNNIAMPLMVKEAKKMWQGFYNTVNQAKQDAIKKAYENKGANIGREGDHAAISGYFDEMWAYQSKKPEGVLKGRKKEVERYNKKQAKNKKALEIARANGWIPPTTDNTVKKFNTYVSPKQFETLINLMTELEGLSTEYNSQFGIKGHRYKFDQYRAFLQNIDSLARADANINRDGTNLR